MLHNLRNDFPGIDIDFEQMEAERKWRALQEQLRVKKNRFRTFGERAEVADKQMAEKAAVTQVKSMINGDDHSRTRLAQQRVIQQ